MPKLKTTKVFDPTTMQFGIFKPQILPIVIPTHWVPIPDQEALDILLQSVGRVRAVMGYIVSTEVNRQIVPVTAVRWLMKNSKGYHYWWHDNRVNDYKTMVFKDFDDLVRMSDIGLFMYYAKKTSLFYDPKYALMPTEEELMSAEQVKPWDLNIIKLKKNPVDDQQVLRKRNLGHYGGAVYLARVDSPKGKYTVWADDVGSMYAEGPFRTKYGYPARYDLKHYTTYHDAMYDWLRRDALNRPVPLAKGVN